MMDDFDSMDLDGDTANRSREYDARPQNGGPSYRALEAMVFNAIDKGYRTLPRIKDHAGLERAFDLTPVIEGMEIDRKIRRFENGTITGFFRPNQKPKRFWLNGDGTVGAEWDETFMPRDEEAKAKEMAGYGDPLRSDDVPRAADDEEDEDEDEIMTPTPAKFRSRDLETNRRRSGSPKKGRNSVVFSYEALEQAASRHYSQADVGKALGTTQRLICRRMQTDPEFKAAFDRGRKAFIEANPGYTASKKREGSKKLLVEAVKNRREKAAIETVDKPKRGTRRALPKKARKPHKATAPAVDAPKEELEAAKSESGMNLQFQSYPSTTGRLRLDYPQLSKPVHSRYITLPGGMQFLVAFEGNIFNAGSRAMTFIRRVQELLDEFEVVDTRELDEGVKWTGVVR